MLIDWPSTDLALALWALLLLGWVFAAYYVGPTTTIWGRAKPEPSTNWIAAGAPRAAFLFVAPFAIYGTRIGLAALLAVLGVALILALTWARERGRDSWRALGAEWELGATAAFVALSAVIVGDAQVTPWVIVIRAPIVASRVAALGFTLAIVLFLINGGTQIVRAILNKAKAEQADETEYNRGRLIGSIERVLLLAMVATGNWGALGFVIAAKSLVRAKEFENRKFAEYFLIGTLTSTSLAIVAGALVRTVFVALW